MIHIVTGPPCAGKTTYVAQRKAASDVVLDFDALEQALGSQKDHDAPDSIMDSASAARRAVLDCCASKGYTAWAIYTDVPDTSNLGSHDVRTVDPGIDECIRRAEADGRPDGTVERIRKWYADNKKGNPMHRTKEFAVKAAGNGHIVAYASTWDREPDCYGDVVRKGAFADTIKAHEDGGKKIPLLYGHVTNDPDYIIGEVTSAIEDDKGFLIEADFNDGPKAQTSRSRVQDGTLCKMSFAYDIKDEAPVTLEDGSIANELRKLDVFEVSLVPIPANQHADVVSVKDGSPGTDACKPRRRKEGGIEEVLHGLEEAVEMLRMIADEEGGDGPEANPQDGEEPKARNALLAKIEEITK